MLRKIRKADLKKILWFLVIVIVPAFVFWGASYFIKERGNFIGKIYGKKISPQDFEAFLRNIQALFLLRLGRDAFSGIKPDQLNRYAWQQLLFIEKAKRENIQVSDEEVLEYIKNFPFLNLQKSSLKERYLAILNRLRIIPGQFEGFLKDIIRAEKLKEKVLKNIEVSEQEIRERYKQLNEEAKAKYILIELKKIEEGIVPEEEDLKKFFQENKEEFRVPPKVKIAYILLDSSREELLKEVERRLKKESLKEVAKKFNLEVIETDYFSAEEPIKGLGWQRNLALKAFEVEKNKTYGPFQVEEGFIFFVKIDQKPSYIPEFTAIKDEVKKKLIEEKTYQEAKNIASQIISEISKKNVKDLKEISLPKGASLQETTFFTRKDFIENIGLDMNFKNIVFSLKEGQIYPKPLEIKKGFCIVQLIEKKNIDEEKFKEEKENYRNLILQEKRAQTLRDYIAQLIKESKLLIYKL